MPEYTNKHGLPAEFVSALTKNRYSGDTAERASDYSTTTLISPVQQTILKKRYPDCGTQDVIDNLWSMFGSIAHSILEEHGSDNSHTEQRFYTSVLGKVISGGVDHYKDKQITDYKVTSVWKVMKKNYTEWEAQLNVYKYLLNKSGFEVNSIRIITILRDWSESDSYKPDYPKAPIHIIDIPMWSFEKCFEFVTERVALLCHYEKEPDELLLECTPEEMWASPDKWAIYKTLESKRATKVFDTEQEAIDSKLDGVIVKRHGTRRRCEKYCIAKNHCNQYARFKEGVERDGTFDGQEPLF